jgi:molybdopterin converting factor small subunit
MARVHVPSLVRDLTGGAEQVEVPLPPGRGATVADLLRELERRFPGVSERLLQDGDLMPGLAVFVDGVQGHMKLAEHLDADSQVHFLPALVGG